MISHKKGAGTTPQIGPLQPYDGSCPYAQARLRLAAAGIARVSDKIYAIIKSVIITGNGLSVA